MTNKKSIPAACLFLAVPSNSAHAMHWVHNTTNIAKTIKQPNSIYNQFSGPREIIGVVHLNSNFSSTCGVLSALLSSTNGL